MFASLGEDTGTNRLQQISSIPLEVTDLSGQTVDALDGRKAQALVFLFLSVDCPISNRYAPELRRLDSDFSAKGVLFQIVYPNRQENADAIRQHIKDYNLPFRPLRDPKHRLTESSGVHVTPEAAVFAPGRGWVYHGRIDDRNAALGQERLVISHHDLRDLLVDLLDGKAVEVKSTPAIGCSISSHP
jgi:hypothetical protein